MYNNLLQKVDPQAEHLEQLTLQQASTNQQDNFGLYMQQQSVKNIDMPKYSTLSKSKAFGVSYQDLTQTNLVKFHVDTGDAKPVYKRPYGNMSFSELETLQKEIGDMLAAGTLVPVMHSRQEAPHSGWSF